ncbi:MAG: dihydrodipicolinate synthase family protein, partial [Methyloligellaceae bacterium]
VKDSTTDLSRVSTMRHLLGPEFNHLSGEDATVLAHMAHGGQGMISVTANVAPRPCSEFLEACMAGDFAKALDYQDRLLPLHKALFLEPSPAPAKYALSVLGRMEADVRSPIVAVTDATKGAVKEALKHAGLTNA